MSANPRITRVGICPLKAPLIQPFAIAVGRHDALDNVLLILEFSDGTKGYGEAAVAPHITGETVSGTMANLRTMAGYLKGAELGDYLKVSSYLRSVFARNMAAVAAVEMALYDALGKTLGVPLWKIWNAKPLRFTTDITIVLASLDETRRSAQQFYRQGFRAFKIKVGGDWDLDLKRVQAVAGVTRGSALIVDANQAFTAEKALAFLKSVRKAGIRVDLLEQPVARDDWEGLKKVSRLAKVTVCADESAASLSQAVKIIRAKACGAINIKLMKTGLADSIHIAQLARARGIKLMIGGMMESSLAMTAAAHLAAGLGCFDFIDLDTPFFIKDGRRGNPYLSARGVYDLSSCRAGIGIVP